MNRTSKHYGVCRLTGHHGKLVRSHLIPKALTRTPNPGEPRAEAGEGTMPKRRFDSWFDNNLVSRAGEDILARYDDWGIRELRRLGLLWDAQDGSVAIEDDPSATVLGDGWYARKVAPSDPQKLRLFFLSLLWRAAATDLAGFTTIQLTPRRLDAIGKMLLAGSAEPIGLFPTTLIQLRTKGEWHILTPTSDVKRYESSDRSPAADVRFFRFFLHGLVAHIDDEETDAIGVDRHGPFAVGFAEQLWVLSRPYEGSHQQERLSSMILEYDREHRAAINRIFARRSPIVAPHRSGSWFRIRRQ